MVIKTVDLETVVGVTTKKLPRTGQPEIAFAGRSNVGKSSLINALMNRKNYARVSEVPGKTQTINFYHINNEFYLVDLPGYGYAKVKINFRASWGPMIERYFGDTPTLKAIFLLLDIRRKPSEDDMMMYNWIRNAGYRPIVIATKSDKLNKSELRKADSRLRADLGADETLTIIPFSAKSKAGRDDIYALMDEILEEK